MIIRTTNGIFRLEAPDGFKFEEDNDTLIIYRNDGVGAISITGYHIPHEYNFVIKIEFLDFIKSIDSSFVLEDTITVECKKERCICEFLDKAGKYWKVWVLFSNNCAVFVSYNCDAVDKETERDNVDTIVQSLIFNDR